MRPSLYALHGSDYSSMNIAICALGKFPVGLAELIIQQAATVAAISAQKAAAPANRRGLSHYKEN